MGGGAEVSVPVKVGMTGALLMVCSSIAIVWGMSYTQSRVLKIVIGCFTGIATLLAVGGAIWATWSL